MTRAFRRFLSVPYDYSDQLKQQRAVGLVLITAFTSLLLAAYNLLVVLPGFLDGELPLRRVLLYLVVLPLLSFLIHSFARNGRLKAAIWLFLLSLYLGTLPFVIILLGQTMPVHLLVLAIASGVLLERRQFLVALVVILVTLGVFTAVQNRLLEQGLVQPVNTILNDFGLMLFTILLSALLLYLFSGSVHVLSEISMRDIRHYRLVSAFAESESELSLLIDTMRTIQNELGYSLAQIFLFEPDGSVQRRIRLGLGQRELTTTLVINRGNIVVMNELTSSRQPVEVTDQDEVVRRSHLSERAHRSLTIPIFNGDDLLGALDVQTAQEHPFTANQVEAFRSFGQRLGSALARARLITDLRQAVREREEAAAYMRTQLTQIQGSSRRLLQSGWDQYLQSRGAVFGYDLQNAGGNIVPAADVPQDILPALKRGDVVAEMRGDEQVISAPIISRGEMLGAMTFAVPADRAIGDDEIETVRTIATRLGLALENNRLLEQTQAQALRERKATEVANILLTATSIESLMELAAENFNEALNAINTRIYLEPGVMSEEPPAAHGEPV